MSLRDLTLKVVPNSMIVVECVANPPNLLSSFQIATSPPSVAPQDDSRPIPDHLIPNTWYLIPVPPFPFHYSLCY